MNTFKKMAFLLALGALPLAHAVQISGALANNPRAFMQQSLVQVRLARLMGQNHWQTLHRNFTVVSTLQEGRVIALTGCHPHRCPSDGSLVMYDSKNDAFKVAHTHAGKTRVYQERNWHADMFLNRDAQRYLHQMIHGL